MKTFAEYKREVAAALAPYGLSETGDDLLEGYREYQSCVEIMGEGDITAEPDDDGQIRVYVRSVARPTRVGDARPHP